jgi:hypothetical protein
MCSGSNKKLLLVSALFILFVSLADAQTQVPLSMLEDMLHAQAFSHVPRDAFHRVLGAFMRERYQGRTFVFDMEVKDFTSSFVLYLVSTGAFDKYQRPEPPKTAAKPAFPATHRLTQDLKLFADQESGTVIATLKKGSGVQVEAYGDYADMDNITAKWARVKTEDDRKGWLFSGYLEKTK